MNFDYGGTVFVGEESEDAIIVQKFGYAAWIVKDDIECMKLIPNSNLVMLSLKRKVQWYPSNFSHAPNFEWFKNYILRKRQEAFAK